jgi:hypothetical protein
LHTREYVSDFLNTNSILTGEQFGFRKNLNEKAIFSFREEILGVLNNEMHVRGIACDIFKAFDCVSNVFLL